MKLQEKSIKRSWRNYEYYPNDIAVNCNFSTEFFKYTGIIELFLNVVVVNHATMLRSTVCPGSSGTFYIVIYCIKWVTTSWTHSMYCIELPFFETMQTSYFFRFTRLLMETAVARYNQEIYMLYLYYLKNCSALKWHDLITDSKQFLRFLLFLL